MHSAAVKLVFSFLLSYPLAGLLKRIPDGNPELKNLFSLGCVVPLIHGGAMAWG